MIRSRRVGDGPVAQRVDQGLNRGQRRAQFVRNIADKVAAHCFQPVEMAEILQQHEIAVGRVAQKGRDRDPEKEAGADLDGGSLLLPALRALLPDVGKPVVTYDLDKRFVERVGRRCAQQPLGGRVHQCHGPAPVQHQDAVTHAVQNSVKAGALTQPPRCIPFSALGQAVDSPAQLVEFAASQQVGTCGIVTLGQAVDHADDTAHLACADLQGRDKQRRQDSRSDQPPDRQRRPIHVGAIVGK